MAYVPNATQLTEPTTSQTVESAALEFRTLKDHVSTLNASLRAVYASFDGKYLGSKAAAPLVDNAGAPLVDGALYFNTTDSQLYVYDLALGTWSVSPTEITAFVLTATNLAGGAEGSLPYQSGAGATALLAAGTAGQLVVSGAAPALVDQGTSGQLLTSAGAAAPTWSEPSAVGSSLVLISSSLSTAVAVVDFTSGITSTYDEYEIHFNSVVSSLDDNDLYLRYSQDGGATFKTGATDYVNANNYVLLNVLNFVEAATSQIVIARSISSLAANGGSNGKIVIFSPSNTTARKVASASSCNYSSVSNGLVDHRTVGRFVLNTAAVNAFRLLVSSGTISGNFFLYGVRKS